VPVAGRPAFLRLTDIRFAIITYNVKESQGKALAPAPSRKPFKQVRIHISYSADNVVTSAACMRIKKTPSTINTTGRAALAIAYSELLGTRIGKAMAAFVVPPQTKDMSGTVHFEQVLPRCTSCRATRRQATSTRAAQIIIAKC
jgi:hypothetical protein